MSETKKDNSTAPVMEGETAVRPAPKHRIRKQPKINFVDREVDQVRSTMRWLTVENEKPRTLTAAGEIVLGISQMLYDVINLMRTHEALQAAGEPLADLLEQRLQSVADELKARLAHPEAVLPGDLAE